MAFFIDNILEPTAVEALVDALSDDRLFEDGAKTAAGAARAVKRNQQADPTSKTVQGARELVERALLKNPEVQAAAIPLKIARLSFSRYEAGMAYGPHVDEAFINGARTDLSFTLFLSDPESYEGGALVVQRYDGDDEVKLPCGSLYLYSSDHLHHVAPVSRGIRLAAVGWVESRVRSEEQRAILFDLHQALKQVGRGEEAHELRLTLLRARNSLLRRWAS